MTEQTLAEKLRILADAAEAGDEWVFVVGAGQQAHDHVLNYIREYATISRIHHPKPATIKVGNREINAPLRVMPKDGYTYYVDFNGSVGAFNWCEDSIDKDVFNNANCWATKSDAEAYRDASLAVRKGEV